MSNNKSNKPFSYCFRVYDYDQYLYDVGELRAMGYSIDDRYSDILIRRESNFRRVWLHIDGDGVVTLHSHSYLSERVPNLEYIINELPVIKTSSKAV